MKLWDYWIDLTLAYFRAAFSFEMPGGITFMSIPTRQKLGVSLAAISMVAMIVFLVTGLLRGDWHYVGGGASGNVAWAVYSGEFGVSGYYLIPIFLCGALGAFCLLWPARKPPKLNQ